MAKLDDFLGKKKEAAPILDLSKTVVGSSEEFRRLLEKVPDFKIKPEKPSTEAVKLRDKGWRFKSGKKDLKRSREAYAFANPLPVEMQGLRLDDLSAVTIDWKMLTTERPKTKTEENYFSRLVELGKSQRRTRAQEKRQLQMDPQVRRIKNKSGVLEMRVVSCAECGEDFCNGKVCCKFGYDSFARTPETPTTAQKAKSPTGADKVKRKIKRKSRSKSGKKGGARSKSPRKRSPSKKGK
ncbi:uncharacterized protein LOC132707339 [Cylas formicarius]|uniref:uncharacterized protein LOC132707339 n=1 Tax=Cylas formicarius TaxID=197179 RepID=UPI002958BC3B|nr:uncharacterized protein LOC132707339 [Cylas formicarius]